MTGTNEIGHIVERVVTQVLQGHLPQIREELVRRVISSADELGACSIIVSGGVACNNGLRQRASQFAGYRFLFPSYALSTDNAVMIAAAAFPKFERSEFAGFDLRARANLTLAG